MQDGNSELLSQLRDIHAAADPGWCAGMGLAGAGHLRAALLTLAVRHGLHRWGVMRGAGACRRRWRNGRYTIHGESPRICAAQPPVRIGSARFRARRACGCRVGNGVDSSARCCRMAQHRQPPALAAGPASAPVFDAAGLRLAHTCANPRRTGCLWPVAWPWLALLLPVPWLLRKLLKALPEHSLQALKVPWYALVSGHQAGVMKQPELAVLAALVWLLLLLAAVRPQWVGNIEVLPVTGRDLLLAVDISGSMDTQDMVLTGRRSTADGDEKWPRTSSSAAAATASAWSRLAAARTCKRR
jgi:hypothetical protein